ncbi:uncharacterized protein Pyn_32143 [Prunus yedoensis var. nudiflora]|uniref:Uncharacterized protein n=1 Tax=Prunus yedoensis var. nudiflora TaxID=2094558 RepID=A0A314YFR6_PRUYE|nr:uncharacterized protein Pyn_32143 [Prunus yedoensis var. nudiflora]
MDQGRSRGRCRGRGRGRARGRGEEPGVVETTSEIHEESEEEIREEAPACVQNVRNMQMDDRTTDLFAEFLQAREHGVPQPPLVPPTNPFRMSLLIRDLKKLGVKPFEVKVDHMKEDRWIRNLENYFKILGMTSVEKRSAASSYLHDEARVW